MGLTGVRAAYAVAPADADERVDVLNAMAPSWPVGAHGVALLHAWMQPAVQQWLLHSLGRLRDWKARQHGLCADMGWQVQPGSLANYFCARPDGFAQSKAFLQILPGLRSAGIKLRECTSFGVPGVVRLGVPLECRQVVREPGRLLLAWDLSAYRVTSDCIVVTVRDASEAEALRFSLAAAERALEDVRRELRE